MKKYKIEKNQYNSYKDLTLENNITIPVKNKIEGIEKILVYSSDIKDNIIEKKINKKFKALLELIASIYENDETDPEGILLALTETDKFKKELNNKYNNLLDKKQKEFLEKKFKLIEKELKEKLLIISNQYQNTRNTEIYEETEEKTSNRRR